MTTETEDGRSRLDQLPRQMAATEAAMWTSMSATDIAARSNKYAQGGSPLTMQMNMEYLPTPTVADVQGGRKARSGERSNELLLNGLCHEMEAFGPTPNGSSVTTEKRGAPNPEFAFWLMGFPAEWTSGALAAMRSFRKSRPKSSRPRAKRSTAA